nr:hypothetical protein [uncultured Pedobacter sp.]
MAISAFSHRLSCPLPGNGRHFFPKKVPKNSRLRRLLQRQCYYFIIISATAKGE